MAVSGTERVEGIDTQASFIAIVTFNQPVIPERSCFVLVIGRITSWITVIIMEWRLLLKTRRFLLFDQVLNQRVGSCFFLKIKLFH